MDRLAAILLGFIPPAACGRSRRRAGAALAAARRWITPHSHISGLAGAKAEKLAWHVPGPRAARASRGSSIAFPASTLGRKGAYELRAVARELDLPLLLGGPVLEGDGFWDGVHATPANGTLLEDAAVIVLPAWLEDQPRRLLQAVAAGIPIVATDACGLEGLQGVSIVPPGQVEALQDAVAEAIMALSARSTLVPELTDACGAPCDR